MKTYSIDIFLSNGTIIRLERLTKSKLNKLKKIITVNEDTYSSRNLFHTFKHEDCRHYIMPSQVSHYVTKKVIL